MIWLLFAVVSLVALLCFLRRRYVYVFVDGVSMRPTLEAGDRVLVRRVRPARLRAGHVVVVELPRAGRPKSRLSGRRWMIKRLAAIGGEPVPSTVGPPGAIVPAGCVVVLGDNPARSFDSRQLGFVPVERVLGVVFGVCVR